MDTDAPFLKVFADNPQLMGAVKRVLLKYFDIKNISPLNSNEQLGAITRAHLLGQAAVDDAFHEIARHKTGVMNSGRENPAR